jgi:uncharacterized protein YndB with AHSA1/START domain
MKNNLQFDFLADKKKNTITIKREFAAERRLVWDAYTKSELLDQWFAPAPLTTKTKTMNFSEGGYWLYAMVEPGGRQHWGRMDYLKIRPIDGYTGLDAFCDENGVVNTKLPRANWNVNFKDIADDKTLVENVVTYASLEDLETVIRMGLKEGLSATLEKLDELLAKLVNSAQ